MNKSANDKKVANKDLENGQKIALKMIKTSKKTTKKGKKQTVKKELTPYEKDKEEFKKIYRKYKKFLEQKGVEIDLTKQEILETLVDVKLHKNALSGYLRQNNNYVITTENSKGIKNQQKNPMFPEYRGLVSEYKKYYKIITDWIKEVADTTQNLGVDAQKELDVFMQE